MNYCNTIPLTPNQEVRQSRWIPWSIVSKASNKSRRMNEVGSIHAKEGSTLFTSFLYTPKSTYELIQKKIAFWRSVQSYLISQHFSRKHRLWLVCGLILQLKDRWQNKGLSLQTSLFLLPSPYSTRMLS